MRFAEVFLRLGCSLVAWMLVYTYIVWLAALHVMGCGPDGDAMHKLLLWMAPLAAATTLMTRLTRPFDEIHRILSWFGLPIALLLYFALRNIGTVFADTNLAGRTICEDSIAAGWHALWAPVQLVAVFMIAVILILVWRNARREH